MYLGKKKNLTHSVNTLHFRRSIQAQKKMKNYL